MSKRMLIEATHAEETRVVVVEESRLEELDVETSTKNKSKETFIWPKSFASNRRYRRLSSNTAATATGFWPLMKFIRTIIKSRWPIRKR